MLEQRLYLAELFDIYGPLLTEKQRRCLELHLYEDFSLSEIGESLAVSRQAVYDILHRSEQIMMGYESKLELVKRYRAERRALTDIYKEIAALPETRDSQMAVKGILKQLNPLLGRAQEDLD